MLRFPPPFLPRLFEGWRTWEKFRNSDDSVGYHIGFVPSNRYNGYNHMSSDVIMPKHVVALNTTISFISEISPNSCRWCNIQCANLKANLPTAVRTRITKNAYTEVSALQESFRRNDKEVDEEVRAALVAKMNDHDGGRSNADLTMEQVSFQSSLFIDITIFGGFPPIVVFVINDRFHHLICFNFGRKRFFVILNSFSEIMNLA